MRRSVTKSANVLATLSILTGAIGTATQAYAGSNTVSVTLPEFSIPQYEVTVPHSVGSRIDEMDKNLRAQFPQKLTDEQRQKAAYVHGLSTFGALVTTMFSIQIGKSTDSRLKKQVAVVNEQVKNRLPTIESKIEAAERDFTVYSQKAAAIQEAVANPKQAVANLLTKFTADAAELEADIGQRQRDLAAFEEAESHMMKAGGADSRLILSAIAERKTNMRADLARVEAQYQTIFAEIAEMKTTNALPISVIGKNGSQIAPIILAREDADRSLRNLRAEKAAINEKFNSVMSKARFNQSFLNRFADKSLRVIGVVGSLVLLGDQATSYYIGYVLGHDPTSSPTVQLVMDAPKTEEYQRIEKKLREAAAEISYQYNQMTK